MQSDQHTASLRWLLIWNWTFRVRCYVLSKKNVTYWWKSMMHCGTIVFITKSCQNPPAFCAHFTVKVNLSEVAFDVCILEWCMWFMLKGGWAISFSGNIRTTYCSIRYVVSLDLFCSFSCFDDVLFFLWNYRVSFVLPAGSVFTLRLFNVTVLRFEVDWRRFQRMHGGNVEGMLSGETTECG
jgi:hypothetical protein